MARLRRDTLSTSSTTHSPTSTYVNPPMPSPSISKPFRIFSTGTIFLTYSLDLCSHPVPGTASRAQAVTIARGGSAGHILGFLAALPAAVEPMLIASLGASPDGIRLRDELETGGVRTKYCKPWPGLGVPSAWVMHARDTGERTVINHNPLPEVSHEDFIALLGPVLAPENYVGISHPQLPQPPSPAAVFPNAFVSTPPPRNSLSSRPATAPAGSTAPHMAIVPTQSSLSPAPFDWMHFEGRSIKTTLSNILGVDGLARERKWRAHCVLSVDLGRRAREGVEAVCPCAFLKRTLFDHFYATSSSPTQTSSSFQRKHFPRSLIPNLTLSTLAHLLRALSSLRSHDTHLHTRSLYYTEVPLVQPSSPFPLVNTSNPLPGLHSRWADPMHTPTPTYTPSCPPLRVSRACAAGQNFGLAAAAPIQAGSPWAITPHLPEIVTADTQKTTTTSQEGARHRRENPSTHLMMTTTKMTQGLRIPLAGHPCPTHFPILIFALTVMATTTHMHVLPSTYRALYPCSLHRRLRRTYKMKRARIPRSSRE